MTDEEGVCATVYMNGMAVRGVVNKPLLIKFERGHCFIVDPGKSIFDIKPKSTNRTDAKSLKVDTGFLDYGNILMRFDSSAEADAVEIELRKLITPS